MAVSEKSPSNHDQKQTHQDFYPRHSWTMLVLFPAAFILGKSASAFASEYFGFTNIYLQYAVAVATAITSYLGGWAAINYFTSDNTQRGINASCERNKQKSLENGISSERTLETISSRAQEQTTDQTKSPTHFRDLVAHSYAELHSRGR